MQVMAKLLRLVDHDSGSSDNKEKSTTFQTSLCIQITTGYIYGNPRHGSIPSQYLMQKLTKRILLDTGDEGNDEYISNLKDVMKQHSITLESILISHWHHDHIGGLRSVLAACDGMSPSVKKFPNEATPNLEKDFEHLTKNDEVKVDGATLKIIHTPGHTTDHLIVHLQEDNAVFSGDCILGEGTTVFEDLYTYMKSLQTILDLKPSVIYPGHGPVIKDPIPVISGYISHRNKREEQIIKALKAQTKPILIMDLVPLVYEVVPDGLALACAKNIWNHLTKLQKEGLVESTDDVIEKRLWSYCGNEKGKL